MYLPYFNPMKRELMRRSIIMVSTESRMSNQAEPVRVLYVPQISRFLLVEPCRRLLWSGQIRETATNSPTRFRYRHITSFCDVLRHFHIALKSFGVLKKVDEKWRSRIVKSVGSTPINFFNMLAKLLYKNENSIKILSSHDFRIIYFRRMKLFH